MCGLGLPRQCYLEWIKKSKKVQRNIQIYPVAQTAATATHAEVLAIGVEVLLHGQ